MNHMMQQDYPAPPEDPEYHGQTPSPYRSRDRLRRPGRVLVIGAAIAAMVVLASGAAAAYVLTRHPAAQSHNADGSAAAAQKPATSALPDGVQKTANGYVFKSKTLNIGVTYPLSWTLHESADKQEVIITSPQSPYIKKDGTSGQNVFTLKLRYGIIPDAIKNTVMGGTAVADSEVIAYAQPTTDQRQYTNLTYAGPDANNFGYVIISGYTAYKAGQALGGGIDLNGQAYMFAGGYGADATDALLFDPVPKASYNTAIFKQAVGILESLQLF